MKHTLTAIHTVYFEDECPSVGCGWRQVIVRVGWKWVYVRAINAKRGTKIKRPIWDKLRKHHENPPLPKRNP